MSDSGHCVLILGCPGSGKSTYALRRAREDCERSGRPILVLDPARVDTFRGIPHAPDLRELAYRVWDRGEHTAWSPEAEADWDGAFKLVRKLGQVIVVADELRFYASSLRVPLPAVLVARTLRHLGVTLYCTSQSYGDLGRPLTAVAGEVVVFRMVSPRDLERLREDYGLDPAKISALPRWEPEVKKVGF